MYKRFVAALLLTGAYFQGPAVLSAWGQDAAELLPDSTIAYLDVRKPTELRKEIEQHAIAKQLLALPQVKEFYGSKEFIQFRLVQWMLEWQLGATWRKAIDELAGDGIAIAIDGESQGLVVLLHGREEAKVEKFLNGLLKIAKDDAKKKGNEDSIKESEYRGIKAYRIDQARVAQVKNWVVITNKDETGKELIDSLLDGRSDKLSDNGNFKESMGTLSEDSAIRVFVDLKEMRERKIAEKLFAGKADDFFGELLLGGVLEVLPNTDYAVAQISVGEAKLEGEIKLPFGPKSITESRYHFFGENAVGRAPVPLNVPGAIASLTAYRNISDMWLRAGDLFNDKVNEDLANADNTLTTIFSGNDFGEDILGAVRPEFQLVVAKHEFELEKGIPAVQLPGFAMVFELKDPEKRKELRRVFHSLLGFLNITAAMEGNPQIDIDVEKVDGNEMVTGYYVIKKGETKREGLQIQYNFSPTVAFVDNRFILSSTRQLADSAIKALGAKEDLKLMPNSNTWLEVDGNGVLEAIQKNREQLINNNMLEEGNTRQKAENEIDLVEKVAAMFKRATGDFQVHDNNLSLRLVVEANELKESSKSEESK